MNALKKNISIGIALVLIAITAMGSFAGAFAVLHANSQPSSFYQVASIPSHFNVTTVQITAQGFNSITVAVSLKNLDSTSHSTNVTVSLMSFSSTSLAQSWSVTGTIPALGNTTEVFSFNQQNILLNYSSSLISLSDVS